MRVLVKSGKSHLLDHRKSGIYGIGAKKIIEYDNGSTALKWLDLWFKK